MISRKGEGKAKRKENKSAHELLVFICRINET